MRFFSKRENGFSYFAGMEIHYLFVYGTLKRGFSNPFALILQQNATYIEDGTFPGLLFRVSWYPAAIYLPDRNTRVFGEIYKLTFQPESILEELDNYEDITPESSEYVRQIIPIVSNSGIVFPCWTYLYNQPVEGLAEIPGGNFENNQGS